MFQSLHLQTLFVGQDHQHFDELSSTNEYLKQLIREKLPNEGFLVTTAYQTSGRGQVGNAWESQKGKNLLMSLFLRPQSLFVQDYFHLNMSVCLAITDSLDFFHPGFLIKWPNDILFDHEKVAGVLIENSISRNKLKHSVVGIGINVNQQGFDAKQFYRAGSLSRVQGQEIDLEFLLSVLMENMEARYLQMQRDPASVKDEYFGKLYGYQQQVRVRIDGNTTKAKILDVHPDGTLMAQVGEEVRGFQFKEISFVL